MKDLAPEIFRQRLLIEGIYQTNMNEGVIREYFDAILKTLNLRAYGAPIIHSTGGEGKEINQGYDAFVPLVDSGISVYILTKEKFLSVIIYTCKSFDERKALDVTKEFFNIIKIESKSF